MMTRKLANSRTALVAGLIAGLAGQTALATDVVTAYGDDAVRQAREMDDAFQARLNQNAMDIEQAVRANVEREITRIKAPAVVRLALSETATRG